MNFLLDTNACIAIINKSSAKAGEHCNAAQSAGLQIFLSSIVVFELWFGVENSARPQSNRTVLLEFLNGSFGTLPFSNEDAETAAQIRAILKATGTPIGAYDTLIAGQALARGLTLVTANTREFQRVKHLKLVDWTGGTQHPH
jgi:tRNA(fMet)-specific endonuclease VapC